MECTPPSTFYGFRSVSCICITKTKQWPIYRDPHHTNSIRQLSFDRRKLDDRSELVFSVAENEKNGRNENQQYHYQQQNAWVSDRHYSFTAILESSASRFPTFPTDTDTSAPRLGRILKCIFSLFSLFYLPTASLIVVLKQK